MSKHRYRSEQIKQLDWNKLSQRLGDQPFVLAVDVAKEDFVAAIVTADRQVVKLLKWRHPEQTRELLTHLEQSFSADQYCAVMEPSGSYGDVLRWQLQQRGVEVRLISPKRVHDAAEVYDGVPSLHDAKAASLIGRLHWEGVSREWKTLNESRRASKAYLAQLTYDKQRQQKASNRLGALLSRHWPELEGIMDLQASSVLRLLERYGCPAAVCRDLDGAGELMKETGGHFLQPQKIEQVLDAARQSLGVPCIEPEREQIQTLATELLELHQLMRRHEQRLRELIQPDDTLRRAAAVVGTATAVALEASLGSPQDYPSSASYLKAAGLNLKERSSGKHVGQLKLTKRGPSVVRFYLYWAALRLIRDEPLVRAWMQSKAERDGGCKSKAIIAVMRKLLKALWCIGQGETFDVQKLFDSRRLTVNPPAHHQHA
jgi:transposase